MSKIIRGTRPYLNGRMVVNVTAFTVSLAAAILGTAYFLYKKHWEFIFFVPLFYVAVFFAKRIRAAYLGNLMLSKLLKTLKKELSSDFEVYTGFRYEGVKLDALVVSDSGVVLVSSIHHDGHLHREESDKFLLTRIDRKGREKTKAVYSPIRHMNRAKKVFEKDLSKKGIDVHIKDILYFSSEKMSYDIGDTGAMVYCKDSMERMIEFLKMTHTENDKAELDKLRVHLMTKK